MDIAYLHLYVRNAAVWRDWFIEKLNFQPVSAKSLGGLGELAVTSAQILILISSTQLGEPDVDRFLHNHAEGVADIAFRVRNLDAVVARIQKAGGQLIQPIRYVRNALNQFRVCRVQGWGSTSHSLIEYDQQLGGPMGSGTSSHETDLPWLQIDHAVLNVAAGDLTKAVAWYETQLGFVREQEFAIATAYSGLRSLVLRHPDGTAKLPVNEPTSPNSQIQEFLDLHKGAGIQHVALQTRDLVQAVASLRQRGVPFLTVPEAYYQELRARPGFWAEAGDWQAIADQQILVDWSLKDSRARLLQTFMPPLLEKPTFFWELIERQAQVTPTGLKQVDGFGEGNFQALFEAIEREQQQRGSL